jgi:hypothetical protein
MVKTTAAAKAIPIDTRKLNGESGAHADAPAPPMFDPSMMLLPYVEMSRALVRAHHNAKAMIEANRTLSDSLRTILRRQQDLAFEIAEQAMNAAAGAPTGPGDERETVFHRAAEAVRELGEAMITAQLHALDTLRDKSLSIEGVERAI